MGRIGRGLCQTAGAGEPGRPCACPRRVVPVRRKWVTPGEAPCFSCPLIVLSMGTDRGERLVLVSKDTSLVSIEAHDDGASDEEAGRWRAARRAREGSARACARAQRGEREGKGRRGEDPGATAVAEPRHHRGGADVAPPRRPRRTAAADAGRGGVSPRIASCRCRCRHRRPANTKSKKREGTALWWDSNQRGTYSTVSPKHGPPKADVRLVRSRAYKAHHCAVPPP